ncbi:MAG: HEAT repeat domain-containing protein [Deltaproteobacteria bacterium]|nr:HEAT repeat domain-containing protein [Deltaproteobacteria bacterium]
MFGLPPLRRTLEAALRDVESDKPEVRAAAATDLGFVDGDDAPWALGALRPLLEDSASVVRAAAVTSLGILRDGEHLEALARCFDDEDPRVRQEATVAVASLGGPRALEVLRAGLEHPHAEVRYQALLALAVCAPEEGLGAALSALESPDRWIASEAALLAGQLLGGDPERPRATPTHSWDEATHRRVREALARRLDDLDDRVAVCAAASLARLGDATATPVLLAAVRGTRRIVGDDAEEVTLAVLNGLALAPERYQTEARAALGAVAWRLLPSPRRLHARVALCRLGDARACQELLAQLRSPWPARRVEAAKMARLARYTEALEPLLGLLAGSTEEVFAAVEALGSLGGRRAREALLRLSVDTEDEELRVAARRAAAGLSCEEEGS